MIRILLLALVSASLAACSGSQPVRYYTLMPGEGIVNARSDSAVLQGKVVSVGPVSIPTALDQPQMVVTKGPHEVDVVEDQRWAAPLKDELTAALVARLARLLPGVTVAEHAQSAARDEDLRVLVDVTRFALAPGGQLGLDALWTIKPKALDGTRRGRTDLTVSGEGSGYSAWAAAGGNALDGLARDIAAALRETKSP